MQFLFLKSRGVTEINQNGYRLPKAIFYHPANKYAYSVCPHLGALSIHDVARCQWFRLVSNCLDSLSLLQDHNLLHHVALAHGIDHVQAFIYFAERGVITIQMFGVVAAVANKELRPAGVASGVGHR